MRQKDPVREKIFDCKKYIMMNDIYLFEKCINIKEEVRLYLGKIFYQMSALVPHDY